MDTTVLEERASATSATEEPAAEREHGSPEHGADDNAHAPDLTAKLFVAFWLPAAGALLAYVMLRSSYLAAFVGIELLFVGWFGLGKL